VHVRRLVPVAREEEEAIGAALKNGRAQLGYCAIVDRVLRIRLTSCE
jgi:hypothetical protein